MTSTFEPFGADPATGQLPAVVEGRVTALAKIAGIWRPTTGYNAGQVVQAPDGTGISRNSDGTSRASFDSTEQAAWTPVLSKSGTIANTALVALVPTLVPDASTTVKGKLVLADNTKTDAGTDNASAITPLQLARKVAGMGSVLGPVSSVVGRLVKFISTDGKSIDDAGVAVSTDGTLAGNSDTNLPTEKAVKTYSDATKVTGPVSSILNNLLAFAGTTGKVAKDSGVAPSTDGTFAANSDALLPTQKAAKTYADTKMGGLSSSGLDNFVSFADLTGKAPKDSGAKLDTDGTAAANSDARVPSQKAMRSYVAAALAAFVPSGSTRKRMSANGSNIATTSLATAGAQTALDQPVVAGARYEIYFRVYYWSDTTDDLKIDVQVPTNATFFGSINGPTSNATTPSATPNRPVTGANNPLIFGGLGHDTTVTSQLAYVEVEGEVITTDTAGNVQVRVAQNATTSGFPLVPAAGSHSLGVLVG